MESDRNLLFSVLAFQRGAIDADRLAETLAETAADVTLSLPEQMVDRGWLTVEQKTELEQALDQELKTHGDDLEATLAAALDGRCREALCLAPKGESQLETKQTQAYIPDGPVLIGSLDSEEEEAESRERYTLSHLYAKGGMGQVWLAHDPALGREIALKELRPEQADNASVCSRFMTEARVTAQLEHPGIVPVYELGEGGSPYYTMRFVRGGTLGQATRKYHKARADGKADPVGLVKLLGAFVGVCHAIGYAHSKGFIHRDLKGQNVVLGDYGEVIVLDWGLARRIQPVTCTTRTEPDRTHPREVLSEAGINGDETLLPEEEPRTHPASEPQFESGAWPERTIQGQLLGTPAYMAPEQAEGRHRQTDERTDVYGLGAILYEILTGQPPFHAKTTKDMLRKVRHEPPTPPRQINPEVAPALQAVCLKALAKRPEDRYRSAIGLAQEVQRYLADEPVEAYPEPWLRRASRWARKHRTAVAAGAGLAVMAIVALSVSTVLVARERNEARIQGQQARKAVDDMYTEVAESWLEDRLDPVQNKLLEKTLNYYEKFTSHASNDPPVQLEHGRDYQRMGDIHRKFGRTAASEQAYHRALAMLGPLAKKKSVDPEVLRALAVTKLRLGDLLMHRDQTDDAERLFRDAEATIGPLGGGTGARMEDHRILALAMRSRAELLRRKSDLTAAGPLYQAARVLLEKALAASPGHRDIRNELATTNDVLGRLFRDLGETAASEQAYLRAYDLAERLVAECPTIPRYRESLFQACNSLGGVEHETGRWEQAEVHWRRELKEAERLAQDYPERPEYKRFVAAGSSNLGGILTLLGRDHEAEPILRQAINFNTELLSKSPDDHEVRFDLGKCQSNLGYLLLKLGRTQQAISVLEQARDTNRPLAKGFPDTPRYRQLEAGYLSDLGRALVAEGRPGAEEAFRQAMEITESLVSRHPNNAQFQFELARCLDSFSGMLANAQRNDEAENLYQKALAVLETKDHSAWTVERLREKVRLLVNLGDFRSSRSKPGAEQTQRDAVELARELASRQPPARIDRQNLALAQNNLADTLRNAGKLEDARRIFAESVAGLEALAAEVPTAIETQNYLGYVAGQQGELLARMGQPTDARTALEKAVEHQKAAIKLTDGSVPAYREMLVAHLGALAGTDLSLGAYDEAIRTAIELAKAHPTPGQGYLDAAKLLARCATQVQGDTSLAVARRDALGRNCLGRTVVMLREAIDANARLAESIKSDSVFKGLLERPEFQTMLSSLVNLGPTR
jgi:serine/threonine protein kinase